MQIQNGLEHPLITTVLALCATSFSSLLLLILVVVILNVCVCVNLIICNFSHLDHYVCIEELLWKCWKKEPGRKQMVVINYLIT